MSGKHDPQWSASKSVAKGLLRDRTSRRRAMARCLMLLLAVFAIGLWGIDDWLKADIWRFFLWWAGCAMLALFTVLFAFYDAMAVIREEREKMQ